MHHHTHYQKSESGQVIILMVFGIISFLAIAGLAIDGGRVFSDRRSAQNAADGAVLTAALAHCSDHFSTSTGVILAALDRAASNGYDNDGITNTVVVNNPPSSGFYTGNTDYYEVVITTVTQPTFIHLVYKGPLESTVRSVAFCDDTKTKAGFPPIPFAVYGGDPACGSESILISGNTNTVYGPIHSNGDWNMSGNTNDIFGEVTYAGVDTATGMSNYIESGPTDNDTVYDWPLTGFDFSDYRPGGIYSSDPNYYYAAEFVWSASNITIPPGIYYATEKIAITGSNVTGNVTFILEGTGDGSIDFSGNYHHLTPYKNDLLVFSKGKECSASAIAYSGNHHDWEGIVYSPYGQIQMSGNASNTINGCLWAAQVKFSGNALTVGNCEKYAIEKTISLTE